MKGRGGERKRTFPVEEFKITDVNLMMCKRYTTQERLVKLHCLICKLILIYCTQIMTRFHFLNTNANSHIFDSKIQLLLKDNFPFN